jgi:hypothetical protein
MLTGGGIPFVGINTDAMSSHTFPDFKLVLRVGQVPTEGGHGHGLAISNA